MFITPETGNLRAQAFAKACRAEEAIRGFEAGAVESEIALRCWVDAGEALKESHDAEVALLRQLGERGEARAIALAGEGGAVVYCIIPSEGA